MTVDSRVSASSAAVLSAALSNGNDSNRLILTKITQQAALMMLEVLSVIRLSLAVCVCAGGRGGGGACVRFGDAMAY